MSSTIRAIKGIYQILTGHYVQVALAWVGIFYLLITVGYWLRNRPVWSETDEQKNRENRQSYVEQLNCLGVIAAGAGLLFLSVLGLIIVVAVLEKHGLPPGLACLTPLLLVAVFVVCKKIKEIATH